MICKVHDLFQISKEEELSFNYLGLQFTQSKSGIILNQKVYIDAIKTIVFSSELRDH